MVKVSLRFRDSDVLWDKPAKEDRCRQSTEHLRHDEPWHVPGANPGEGVARGPRKGDSGICERCRGGEPVGCGNVGSNRISSCRRPESWATPDDEQQSEGGDCFTP